MFLSLTGLNWITQPKFLHLLNILIAHLDEGDGLRSIIDTGSNS